MQDTLGDADDTTMLLEWMAMDRRGHALDPSTMLTLHYCAIMPYAYNHNVLDSGSY